MTSNERFIYDVTNIFTFGERSSYSSRLGIDITLDKNNVYTKYLTIDINDNNEIELPIIAVHHFAGAISNAVVNKVKLDKIVLPLYDTSFVQTRRTFDSIIRNAFVGVDYECRLQKFITGKGDIYYGGKGLILDGNFSPMVMCTVKVKKVKGLNDYAFIYSRPICHVNSNVFLNPNDIVSKGIIKKLIPTYLNTPVGFPSTTTLFYRGNIPDEDRKVQVIIDKLDNFFVTPVKPTPSTCSNEILNQCLIDNLDEILYQL